MGNQVQVEKSKGMQEVADRCSKSSGDTKPWAARHKDKLKDTPAPKYSPK